MEECETQVAVNLSGIKTMVAEEGAQRKHEVADALFTRNRRSNLTYLTRFTPLPPTLSSSEKHFPHCSFVGQNFLVNTASATIKILRRAELLLQ